MSTPDGDALERTSYLAADEVQLSQTLHKRAPFALCNVSTGFFSIARYYGGMAFQGCAYRYIEEHDECVRVDVLRLVRKMRKKTAGGKAEPAQQPMRDLWS